MSYILHDPDEWTTKVENHPCGHCQGDMRRCNGMCTGSTLYALVRRPQAEIDAIKAEKSRKHDADILAEADAIRARQRQELIELRGRK